MNYTQSVTLEWRSGHDGGMPGGGREDGYGLTTNEAAGGFGSKAGAPYPSVPAASAMEQEKKKKAYTGRIIMD
ncbi:hypothetical protein ACFFSY_16705 [Paenibacillus aurantiacus]|uniref:Uncharacterized protein n=1 Tax=Paenibacillus aurantiacus TaxID=1936118 RepID=A0ABV5KTM0_9BACL